MSNNKQSSIDWFWLNLTDDLIGGLSPEKISKIYQLKEQAKAIHKGEIITTWHKGYDNLSPMIDEDNCGDKYYNETYRGNK